MEEPQNEAAKDLKPKPPPKLAAQGIRTFTVCRQLDESGVSGTGIVIEGCKLATGQCKPHPVNKTIITFEDGEQETY